MTFRRELLRLTVPIALNNLLVFCMSAVDVFMLTSADDTGVALAGAKVGESVYFIFMLVCFALTSASMALLSQYAGKGDMQSVRRVAAMCGWILTGIGVICFVLCFPLAKPVAGIFSADPRVQEAGGNFLRNLSFCFPAFGLMQALSSALRAVKIVRVTVLLSLMALCTNIFLNWMFIFGNLGAPRLGAGGAAAATAVSTNIGCVVLLIYGLHDRKLGLRGNDFRTFDRPLWRDLWKLTLPVLVNDVIWAVAVSYRNVVIGHMDYLGGQPLAARSLDGTVFDLATILLFGVANASGVIVGRTIGAGDIPEARRQLGEFKKIGFVLGSISTLLLLCLRKPIVGLTHFDNDITSQMLYQMLTLTAFVFPLMALADCLITGGLRSGGDTLFCMFLETPLVLATAVGASVLVYRFQGGILPLYLILNADVAVKAVALHIRTRGTKWVRNLTMDRVDN